MFWIRLPITRLLVPGLLEVIIPLTSGIAIAIFLYACAGIDLLVTGVLLVQIQKNIRGFKENTDGMLKHLIKLAIASASYNAIFATIPAILTVAIPKTSLSFNAAYCFPIPLSSFYALSLLHNLLSSSKLEHEVQMMDTQLKLQLFKLGMGRILRFQ